MPAYECKGCNWGCIKIRLYPPDAPAPEECENPQPGVTAAWRLFEPKQKARRNRR